MEHCDMLKCNPRCLRCGDSPACGDGSWSWMDGVHRHRCRDSHPQCGHDRVPCEKHQPGELIALLRDEVKALRIVRDVKNAEVDRLTTERDALRDEVLAWRDRTRIEGDGCTALMSEDEARKWGSAVIQASNKLIEARAATNATEIKGIEP